MAQVVLENVGKVYGGNVVAVRGVNLHVRDREFLVLVGPSGCGKSTTLRMIAGLEEVSTGTISIGDRVVNDVAPKDRDIAMVFQNYALYPHMTVFENMAFGLKLRRLPKTEIRERVLKAARMLGLADYLDRRPKALSGGQRQRVAMGRAVVREPKVFLFDEPLSNLDAKMRVAMRAELMQLHERVQTTMIYVTHDQVEAMTLGERIVVMHDGEILQADAPLEVYANPANTFVARFIGTPPMNLFHGTLVSEDSGLVFRGEGLDLCLPESMRDALRGHVGRDVELGLRPEHLRLADEVPADDRQAFDVRVKLAETLGNEVLVHLVAGEVEFQMRVDPHRWRTVQGELQVSPLMAYAQIFDADTGLNLTAQSRDSTLAVREEAKTATTDVA